MRESDFVSGFARGLKVIEAFGEMHRRLSITDAAKLTGLDRATVRRSLLTLADLGYADYDGKFFTLTPKILRLGHAYLEATPLPVLIQPHLDALSEKAGQSASASVLDGGEIVYIARASQAPRHVDQPDTRQPSSRLLRLDGPCLACSPPGSRGTGSSFPKRAEGEHAEHEDRSCGTDGRVPQGSRTGLCSHRPGA